MVKKGKFHPYCMKCNIRYKSRNWNDPMFPIYHFALCKTPWGSELLPRSLLKPISKAIPMPMHTDKLDTKVAASLDD
jgi:hypothetical protein